ncbi:diguanylate cyclase [Mariprofundus sp. EBB-1]|uniref:diguanylate cyclase domain-containing protein n=1 Tax=Mariprofundus sp. EBB-1 TaxID=2650971 RepID=UPI000EF1DAB1|nr:diguanylate cyclase [Mariprofundus sp. EBB-1]RLL52286.1 diguanylate cyclase [Mariprofundus sp. EBB-1]
MESEFARNLIDQYGYLAIFVSMFIEGEIFLLAASVLVSNGFLQAHWVITYAAAGTFVAHMIFFFIGRWRGMELIDAVPFLRRHYPKANIVMDKYANWSVFICQYLYGMRLISAVLFGCSTITTIRFSILQLINCISWALLIYFASHGLGILATKVIEAVGLYGLLAVILLLSAVALLVYRLYAHHHISAFLASGREPSIEQTNPIEGRHFALEQLQYHIDLAARTQLPLSLLLLKVPAQTEAVLEGQLTYIATELCQQLRLVDIPARYDKQTFVVVAPSTDSKGARLAIKRLQASLLAHIEIAPTLEEIRIGMVAWEPGMSSGKMLDHAFNDLEPVSVSSKRPASF